jgi:hypothetical protein
LAILRNRIHDLPVDQRAIVALRYGAGFALPEIASALERREGTVARGLEEALELLRGDVVSAGFPAGVWARHREMLRRALLTATPVPAGLRERILKRIDDVEAHGRRARA